MWGGHSCPLLSCCILCSVGTVRGGLSNAVGHGAPPTATATLFPHSRVSKCFKLPSPNTDLRIWKILMRKVTKASKQRPIGKPGR